MFNSTTLATKSAASRPHLFQLLTRTTLSAVLFLALAPSVQAAANNISDSAKNSSTTTFADIFKGRAIACHNGIEAQTSNSKHPNHQNSQRQNIDCMLTQLRAYQQPANHSSRQQYFGYKAQAWLNYASHEDSINSRSSAGDHALQSAAAILKALQNTEENSLNLTTDIPSFSALMRPDLWANLVALKDSGGITTAPRELAFSEVALIWAAANHCDHGWQQSASQFRMADRWLERAREAYINAHDSKTNVALEELINSYYKQFAPLDSSDDSCHGQVIPTSTQALHTKVDRTLSLVQTSTIFMPIPTATYRIVH